MMFLHQILNVFVARFCNLSWYFNFYVFSLFRNKNIQLKQVSPRLSLMINDVMFSDTGLNSYI